MIKSYKKFYNNFINKYFFNSVIKIKMIKFLYIGCVNTTISYGVYLLIGKFLGYKISYIFSFLLNTFLNYIFYKYVFNVNYISSSKNIFIYFVYYLFSALLSFILFLILIDFFKVNVYLSPFLVLIVILNFNFIFNIFFFKKD
jgi:putative flippase GtrA